MPQRWSLGKGIVGFLLALRSLASWSGRSKAPSTWGASGVGASKCECSEPVSKAYMTTTDYTFLGTLITENSLASVMQGKLPKAQAPGVSEQKTKREATVLQKLETATKGPFKHQFSQNRLADAIAMCQHQWSHFSTSGGRLQADRRWLPSELAAQMKQDGCRGLQSPVQAVRASSS